MSHGQAVPCVIMQFYALLGEPDRGSSLRMTQESSRGIAQSTGSRCSLRTSPSAFEVSVFHLRLSLPSLNDPLAIVLRKAASQCDRVPRVPTRATAARMTSSWSRHEAPTPRRQTSLASMSGHPCFASLAILPDRSTPCRPASAEANDRCWPLVRSISLGIASFRLRYGEARHPASARSW